MLLHLCSLLSFVVASLRLDLHSSAILNVRSESNGGRSDRGLHRPHSWYAMQPNKVHTPCETSESATEHLWAHCQNQFYHKNYILIGFKILRVLILSSIYYFSNCLIISQNEDKNVNQVRTQNNIYCRKKSLKQNHLALEWIPKIAKIAMNYAKNWKKISYRFQSIKQRKQMRL